MNVCVLIPIHNDWKAVSRLLPELSGILVDRPESFRVFLIDDGSTERPGSALTEGDEGFQEVGILRLRGNLGHQRAICVGLAYVVVERDFDAIVIMDGDGEDRPADVPRLLDALAEHDFERIVFAERTRRSEGMGFKLGYLAYRIAHRILVGEPIRVGNFSAIPASMFPRFLALPQLWSHYAAAVLGAKLPHARIPSERGTRIAGRGAMDVPALVAHGLAALSVYSERIGVRILVLGAAVLGLFATTFLVMIAVATTSSVVIPTSIWLGMVAAALALIGALLLGGSAVATILASRSHATFLPARDYSYYILGEEPAGDLGCAR